jgi:alkanesulfonate monooxygenase SsuD/methylene tetrahydromethanopterin reductase-like flavin-dependent oxidoreductase (luciferase family)
MRFGFFDQLPCAPGYSEPQRYKDILAQIELGDAAGFDTVWLGEIHFIREFSILADPRRVLAAAAQRTSRIRLGTAVTLLPLHSPIKIAEEAAIVDILSDGRLEFGVGLEPQSRRQPLKGRASPAITWISSESLRGTHFGAVTDNTLACQKVQSWVLAGFA